MSGLPGDPAGPAINHLVVFGNFTPSELTLDYTALFPGISESAFINDLLTTPANTPLLFADYHAFTIDATNDGLYGGNGSPISVVAFSTGQVIGSGKMIVTLPAQVPEPMTLALFSAGLMGVAAVRRRKHKTV